MDWIHCNTCFGLPTDAKFQIFITTCGHLFCDTCLKKAADKKCPMCGQMYSSAIPLSKDMKPDVQIYFQDPNEVFKNGLKQMKLSQQVSEFQKGHSKRLSNHHKRQLSKAGDMMKQAKELERKYRQQTMENDALKHFISSLGYKPHDIMQKIGCFPMTPGQSPKNTPKPMMCETPRNGRSGVNTPTGGRPLDPNQPRNSPMQYRQTSPSPGKPTPRMSPSPSRQNYPPSASQLALNRSKTGRSPHDAAMKGGPSPGALGSRGGPSPGVSGSRLSLRTPPVNGKIGPVRTSPSPGGQSNQLKVAQMLGASRTSIPGTLNNSQSGHSTPQQQQFGHPGLRTPTMDGQQRHTPIQVGAPSMRGPR